MLPSVYLRLPGCGMTRFEPELWVDHPSKAVDFYAHAFGARVLHQVGRGDDIVAQLAVGDAAFWVSSEDPGMGRLGPTTAHGATGPRGNGKNIACL